MALLSNNSITSLFSVRNLLLSMSVLSISTVLKLCLPFLFQFVVTRVPMLWCTLGSWLTPPYLYVFINFIILAIALSSRYQHKIEGTVNVGASITKIPTYSHKKSSEFVKKESPATCKTNFDLKERKTQMEIKKKPMDLEMRRDMKPMKKNVEVKSNVDKKVEMKTIKIPMEVRSNFESNLEAKTMRKAVETNLNVEKKAEMRTVRKFVEIKSNAVEKVEGKTMRRITEVKPKVEEKVEARKTNKNVHFETNTKNMFEVKEKMETRARHRTGVTKVPNAINSTEFKNKYKLSEIAQQTTLQAENDTLEDTWNMIMEKRRLQNAGLEGVSRHV